MTSAILTDHAIERAKERLNLGFASLKRLADKALNEGIADSSVRNGKLKKYLEIRLAGRPLAIRIYGEVLYLFNGEVLVTLYQVPYEFRCIIKKYQTDHIAYPGDEGASMGMSY
jgi:UDP-2,3-diacylglucosamine pyrophosphatase LpxH